MKMDENFCAENKVKRSENGELTKLQLVINYAPACAHEYKKHNSRSAV